MQEGYYKKLQSLFMVVMILSILICFDSSSKGNNAKWEKVEGKHYIVYYYNPFTKREAQDILDFMEKYIYPNYRFFFNVTEEDMEEYTEGYKEKRNSIYLQATLEHWKQHLKSKGLPATTAAFYDPQTQHLESYYDKDETKPFLAHEGMHQFVHINLRWASLAPMWFSEGMADCIGNHRIKNNKFYPCIKDGVIAKERLNALKDAFDEKTFIPLKSLLALSREEFNQEDKVLLHYAESWAFCHFLMNYPDKETTGDKRFRGMYKDRLTSFYNGMRATADMISNDMLDIYYSTTATASSSAKLALDSYNRKISEGTAKMFPDKTLNEMQDKLIKYIKELIKEVLKEDK